MEVLKEQNVGSNDSMRMKDGKGIGDVELETLQLGSGHYLGKGSFGEDDEETGLATGTITDDDEFAADFRHCGRVCGASRQNEVSVSTSVSTTAVQSANVIVVSLCVGVSAVKKSNK